MKFVTMWTPKDPVGSSDEQHEETKKGLAALGRWSAPESETILELVTRLDGQGGFAVSETDDPVALADAAAKFSAWFDFEVIPVMDLLDERTLNHFGEAVAFNDAG
jgi:hypothetical protein